MKLVIQLEKDALDESISVSSLLHEFIFICSKLGVKDMESWARREMNGYEGAEEAIPKYRYIQGPCKFYNPFRGWCPVIFKTKEEERIFTVRPLSSSISEIEEWVHTPENKQMTMEFPAETKSKFAEMNYGMIPATLVDKSQLYKTWMLSGKRFWILHYNLRTAEYWGLKIICFLMMKKRKRRV